MARISTRWLLRGGIGDLNLSKSEALVLLALLDHSEKGIAWCPQTHLARHLRISRQHVNEAQAHLRAIGALIEHEPGRQGRATRYRFGETSIVQGVASPDMSDRANMSDSRGKSNVIDMSSYLAGGI